MGKIQKVQDKIDNLESEIAELKKERTRLRQTLQKMDPIDDAAKIMAIEKRLKDVHSELLPQNFSATSDSRRMLVELENAKSDLREIELARDNQALEILDKQKMIRSFDPNRLREAISAIEKLRVIFREANFYVTPFSRDRDFVPVLLTLKNREKESALLTVLKNRLAEY